jgi:L-ascorbate metabolism protein UlaG (beta-lactamase superfamily)
VAGTTQFSVRVFGGPTALVEYGGHRFLIDPTFDVHYDSWAHFTEGRDELVAAFTAAGLEDRLAVGGLD